MIHPYEEKLRQFLDDEVMVQAVRQILEKQFDVNTVKFDVESDSQDKHIGEIVRAMRGGAKLLAQGFKEIEKYRRDIETKKQEEDNIGL